MYGLSKITKRYFINGGQVIYKKITAFTRNEGRERKDYSSKNQ